MFASNELVSWWIDNTQLRKEQDRCQVCGTDTQMILMYDDDIDYSSLCRQHTKFITNIHHLERELLDTKPVTKSYGYSGSVQKSIDDLCEIVTAKREASRPIYVPSESQRLNALKQAKRTRRRVIIDEFEYDEVRNGYGELVGVYAVKVPPARPRALAEPEVWYK